MYFTCVVHRYKLIDFFSIFNGDQTGYTVNRYQLDVLTEKKNPILFFKTFWPTYYKLFTYKTDLSSKYFRQRVYYVTCLNVTCDMMNAVFPFYRERSRMYLTLISSNVDILNSLFHNLRCSKLYNFVCEFNLFVEVLTKENYCSSSSYDCKKNKKISCHTISIHSS